MYSEIYRELDQIIEAQQSAALCVIVRASGSVPRGKGSKMIVYPDGKFSGTIGGGELEQRVIAVALEVIHSGEPQIVEYSMTDPQRGDPGVCGGQVEVYVEPILPQATVIVVGAGHVGLRVAHLAKWLGFAVVVSDDRLEFLESDEIKSLGKIHHGTMEALADSFPIHDRTYIVLTTRNAEVDAAGLPALMKTEAPFIGVIGSRRRWGVAKDLMLAQGVDPALIERVYSPVGLELNAETPEEIAVSIMAQIIMLRRGGDGATMAK
ncbi:XdhC family protein [bacterium]|nr:XdhC family protein [bacterium]MCB2179412.1 XdhC family protein [bacterium]